MKIENENDKIKIESKYNDSKIKAEQNLIYLDSIPPKNLVSKKYLLEDNNTKYTLNFDDDKDDWCF